MRERHPIDDLFRRVLSDAEATPPPSVWQGVVRQRHWGHRLLLGLERRWGLAMFLLLLLAGAPAAWWSIRDNADSKVRTTDVPAQLASTTSGGVVVGTDRSASTQAADPSPVISDPGMAVAYRSPREQGSGANTGTGGDGPADRGIIGLPEKEKTINATGQGGADEGSMYRIPGEAGDLALYRPSMSGSGNTILQNEARADRVELEVALFRRSDFGRPVLGSGALRSAGKPTSYVLPNGHYWIGLQFGYAGVSGVYEGTSPLAEALNHEEDWLDQSAAGLMVGRRWRNGLSIGIGVELMERRSRFLHSEQQPGPTIITTDTTWSSVPLGPTAVYTWEIDSILSTEPGIERTYSATNTYTILRIPLELGCYREVRRWLFGVRSGFTLTLPLNRTGRTLLEDGDGGILAVEFDNTDAGERFSLGLEGFVGVNAGYMLNEKWTAHLGPVLVRDLGGGGEPALRTTQFGGQVRLEYELPQRERAGVPVEP